MRVRGGLRALSTLALLSACASGGSSSPPDEETAGAGEQPADEPPSLARVRRFSSNLLSAAAPARLDQGISLENGGLGSAVTLRYADADPVMAERDGDLVRYRDALGPGFHVSLAMKGRAMEDTVELPSAPPGGVIRYEIAPDANVAGYRTAHGSIEMLAADGTPGLRVGHAKVIDADGEVHPIALAMKGCAFEEGGLPPWGRPVTPPGSDRCVVEARIPTGLRYPAKLDPTWELTDSMNEGRYDLPLVLLPDGRAFVVGGRGEGSETNAEVYDPATGSWSYAPTADLAIGAYDFTLTPMNDNRVLLAGGLWSISGSQYVDSALVLDVATMTWSALPDMATVRAYHRATLLDDGRVLISGGYANGVTFGDCEIFDPATDSWSPTGDMIEGRDSHEAIAYQGRVLVTGGIPEGPFNVTNTSEIFEPSANGGVGAWTTPKVFQQIRFGHAIALLGDSRAIIMGGTTNGTFYSSTRSVQIYDFTTDTWSAGPDLPVPTNEPGLANGKAERSLDGGVIFTGGCGDVDYCQQPSNLASYFDPVTAAVSPSGTIGDPRGSHGMVRLADGTLLVAGGWADGEYFSSAMVLKGLVDGQPCDTAFQCASNFCVEGVCCDSACDGVCTACTAALTGDSEGTCAPVIAGTDPMGACDDDGAPNCGQNGLCAEGGVCATYDGPGCTPLGCTDDEECDSGHCVDGICCDIACDVPCYACTAAKKGVGGDGTCGPIASGLDPDEDCADGAGGDCAALLLCDGFGACSSAEALCAPFACDTDGCRTSCASTSECVEGFVCIGEACISEDELCKNESILLQPDGSSLDCTPYRCTPTACMSSCTSLDDCATPYVCDGATSSCILPPADTGGDAGCRSSAAPLGDASAGGTRAWQLLALALLALRRRR